MEAINSHLLIKLTDGLLSNRLRNALSRYNPLLAEAFRKQQVLRFSQSRTLKGLRRVLVILPVPRPAVVRRVDVVALTAEAGSLLQTQCETNEPHLIDIRILGCWNDSKH